MRGDADGQRPWRPPLGFIVEGDAEFQSYPTILARGLGYASGHLPILNAAGCCRLVAELESLLDNLCSTHRPVTVIITIDARDFADHPVLHDCAALRTHLEERCLAWLEARKEYAHNIIALPKSIVVVVQHQCFETWLISDPEGLRQAPELLRVDQACDWTNVDMEIHNPRAWLRDRLKGAVNATNPFIAKRIAGHLCPSRMSARSRSFDKFWREVERAIAEAA